MGNANKAFRKIEDAITKLRNQTPPISLSLLRRGTKGEVEMR